MHIIWESHFENVKSYINQNGIEIAYLISPFIVPDVLVELLSHRNNRDTIIITSWRKDHLLTGVSKLGIYHIAKAN